MKMMKLAVCVAALGLAAGCIDSKTVFSVKKDGSGTVLVEDYMSPQMTGMMDNMGGMMQAMGNTATGTTNATMGAKAQEAMWTSQIQERGKSLGEGLTLVSQATVTNAAGWKGYRAVFSFKNIAELRVPSGNAGPQMDQSEKKPAETAYTFEFEAGKRPTLRIVPTPKSESVAKPAKEESNPMGDEMAATMMGAMLKGARQNIVVEVEGEIAETNAKFREGKRQVVLMDVPMDKLTANPAAMKLMMSKSPDQQEKLSKLAIEGLKVEDPAKTVTIQFR